MRKSLGMLTAAAVILGYSVAHAGVVMTETDSMSNGGTPRKSERTIMIEGNKEKLITQRNEIVTDLDKGALYIIDPATKTYGEMPFPPRGPMAQMVGGPATHAMNFTKTGKSRTVVGYKCVEYTGAGKFMMGDFTVNSCMSTSAPGAAEFSKFQKLMVEKLKSASPTAGPAGGLPEGVPLAQDTTTRMSGTLNLPNMPPEQAAKIREQLAKRPPMVSRTEVTKITEQKLAASEFEIPAGFTKRGPFAPRPAMGGGMSGMGARPGAMGGPGGMSGGGMSTMQGPPPAAGGANGAPLPPLPVAPAGN